MSWTEEEFLKAFNYGEIYYVESCNLPDISLRRVRKKNKVMLAECKVIHRTLNFVQKSLPIEKGDMIFYTKKDETISVIKERVTFT
jgi:hypothetical protein